MDFVKCLLGFNFGKSVMLYLAFKKKKVLSLLSQWLLKVRALDDPALYSFSVVREQRVNLDSLGVCVQLYQQF